MIKTLYTPIRFGAVVGINNIQYYDYTIIYLLFLLLLLIFFPPDIAKTRLRKTHLRV